MGRASAAPIQAPTEAAVAQRVVMMAEGTVVVEQQDEEAAGGAAAWAMAVSAAGPMVAGAGAAGAA